MASIKTLCITSPMTFSLIGFSYHLLLFIGTGGIHQTLCDPTVNSIFSDKGVKPTYSSSIKIVISLIVEVIFNCPLSKGVSFG